MNKVNYVELLIGEVLLGDTSNVYMYVCEDDTAETKIMHDFVVRVEEESQQINAIQPLSGLVIVNDTQRFYFTNQSNVRCVAKGTSYDRIFIDIENGDDVLLMKEQLLPHLRHPGGDFA